MTLDTSVLLQPAALVAGKAVRLDRTRSGPLLDRDVPTLLVKIGQYPIHPGGVGVIRTLGRLGVPVYAITEPGLTPAAASRYLAGRFVWPATGHEDQRQLAAGLRGIGEVIGRPAVAIAADDESAVLIAEHQDELSERFLIPPVPPSLPRKLASKTGLFELCVEHDVPAPASITPRTRAEVAAFAATATFPVVVKNAEVWERRRRPVVPRTSVVHSQGELLGLIDKAARSPAGSTGAAGRARAPGAILQEYIPSEYCQDWFVNVYRDATSTCRMLCTGFRVRSWPPGAGATTCAYSIINPVVAALVERFCAQIGYVGIADLDLRLDLRDGQYKLIDFNPRVGNPFRLFETRAGIDVVRAQHLDLTGRQIPASPQVTGRRIIIEHTDVPARIAYRRRPSLRRQANSISPGPASTEYAWLAPDDLSPFWVMTRHVAGAAVGRLRRRLTERLTRPPR